MLWVTSLQPLLKSMATRRYIFRGCQSSKQTSQETACHFNWVERSCLSVLIGRIQSTLFVSVFQGCLAVAMIEGSENVFRGDC